MAYPDVPQLCATAGSSGSLSTTISPPVRPNARVRTGWRRQEQSQRDKWGQRLHGRNYLPLSL